MNQMLGYLNITGLEVALLLNFKEATLDVETGGERSEAIGRWLGKRGGAETKSVKSVVK